MVVNSSEVQLNSSEVLGRGRVYVCAFIGQICGRVYERLCVYILGLAKIIEQEKVRSEREVKIVVLSSLSSSGFHESGGLPESA
jgi:hypothetical protein